MPSVSWKSSGGPESKVHFGWEFGVGGTACVKRIPRKSKVNREFNREITCQDCLKIIYDIPFNSIRILPIFRKRMKNNDDLVKLIQKEIERFGSQKKVADAIGITQGFLNDILRGRAPVTDQVAQYFGYTKVVGFIKDESKRKP